MYIKRINRTLKIFMTMILIREVYFVAIYANLNNLYYVGTGSYGVDLNLQKELIAIPAFLVMNFVFSKVSVIGNLKKTLLIFLMGLYIVPMSCNYSLLNMSDEFFILSSLYCLFLIFALKKRDKVERIYDNHDGDDENNESFFYLFDIFQIRLFCFWICLIIIAYKFIVNGVGFNLIPTAVDLYANRALRSSLVASMDGSLLGYLNTIISNFAVLLIPIYLLNGLKNKRRLEAILAVFTIICEFDISQQKGTILIVPVVLAVYWCSSHNRMNSIIKMFLAGEFFGLLYSYIYKQLTGSISIIFMVLFRRIMYLPVWLNTLYYKFFCVNPKVMWSQNTFLLQKIIPDVYDKSPIAEISQHYFNGAIPTPNTGLFADAYMNLGWAGVFVYPIIYVVIFAYIQKVYGKFGKEVEVVVAIQLVLSLTNIQILRTNFIISFVFTSALLKVLSILRVRGSLYAN